MINEVKIGSSHQRQYLKSVNSVFYETKKRLRENQMSSKSLILMVRHFGESSNQIDDFFKELSD